MTIQELKDKGLCPQWLADAETEDANVDVVGGILQWYSGNFLSGDFWGGNFWGGNFRGGDFWAGDFWGGDFRGGRMHINSKWGCSISPNGTIGIGCKCRTRGDWNIFFSDDCKEELSTERDSITFKRIKAHYMALCAYIDAMGEDLFKPNQS